MATATSSTRSATPLVTPVDPTRDASRTGTRPQDLAPPRAHPPGPQRGPRPAHYQRIWLDGTETTAALRARGVPARTARTAVKRGWYTLHYHQPHYPQAEGPGLFATLVNPYAFATAQVRHVLRTHAGGAVTPEDVEDAVQDALVWAWERRHCSHIADFPAYMSTVIRQKLRQRYGGRA